MVQIMNVYILLFKNAVFQNSSAKETNEHFLIAPSILSADFARLGEEVWEISVLQFHTMTLFEVRYIILPSVG